MMAAAIALSAAVAPNINTRRTAMARGDVAGLKAPAAPSVKD
jgi:hypothetical protein